MMQEGSIKGWLDMLEEKKGSLKTITTKHDNLEKAYEHMVK